MSYQTWQPRFAKWLLRNGETATLIELTGSTCPCMTHFSDTPSYSKQWHRENPNADDCNGTGIINGTYSRTAIYGIFSPPNLVGNSIPGGKEFIDSIGEIQKDDLIIWGITDASLNNVNVTYKSEYVTKVTHKGVDYTLKDMSIIPNAVGQVARLARR